MEAAGEFAAMKGIAIAACAWFSVGMVAAECVTVLQAPVYQAAPSRIRITTLVNGQPLAGTKLAFFSGSGPQPSFSIAVDRTAVAAIPNVPPGKYRVTAAGPNDLVAELYLDVSSAAGKSEKSFSMSLFPAHPPFAPATIMVADAEKRPVSQRIESFAGHVLDPSGGAIPGAEILVIRKGAKGEVLSRLKADESGRFSAALPAGIYVVVVHAEAFRNGYLTIETLRASDKKELRVVLEVGAC
jgi:hypothetical protein